MSFDWSAILASMAYFLSGYLSDGSYYEISVML